LIIASIIAIGIFGWDWTGFFGGFSKKTIATEITQSPNKKNTTTVEQRPGKTLWDWLQLLGVLAIPIVVGFGTLWFTKRQAKESNAENKDNQREKALQSYIDNISKLLLKEKLRESQPEDEVRTIARVRTLTVLPHLDSMRKRSILQFLYASRLLEKDKDKDKPIVELDGADLSSANLNRTNLNHACLSHAYLRGAKLSHAYLISADLINTNLSYVDLSHALLNGAYLNGAKLNLTSLSRADLSGADLRRAKLYGADLSRATLNEADLHGAECNAEVMQEKDEQGKLVTIEPTQWPEGFNPKAAGAICVDCEKP